MPKVWAGGEVGMTDREKVIRLIEEEISVCESVNQCYRTIDLPALRDILALLKEQEAVKPVKQIEQTEWTVCGNCRNHIISKWIFCPYCGKPISWEGQ